MSGREIMMTQIVTVTVNASEPKTFNVDGWKCFMIRERKRRHNDFMGEWGIIYKDLSFVGRINICSLFKTIYL